MERERRRWEEEQAEELDRPVGPVHYEEMRHGGEVDITIRTHFRLSDVNAWLGHCVCVIQT